jgi:hypothetical protein
VRLRSQRNFFRQRKQGNLNNPFAGRPRINVRTKGNAFQRWCRDWLASQGYTVHNQGIAAKMIKDKATEEYVWVSMRNDIFGCDLIAIKSGEKPRYIQCTHDHGIEKRFAEFASYPWPLEHCSVELWSRKPGGPVIIRTFDGSSLNLWGEIARRRLKIY